MFHRSLALMSILVLGQAWLGLDLSNEPPPQADWGFSRAHARSVRRSAEIRTGRGVVSAAYPSSGAARHRANRPGAGAAGTSKSVSLAQASPVKEPDQFVWRAALSSANLTAGHFAIVTPGWPTPAPGVTGGASVIVSTVAGSAEVARVAAPGSDPIYPGLAGRRGLLDGSPVVVTSCPDDRHCLISPPAPMTATYSRLVVGEPDPVLLTNGSGTKLNAPVAWAPTTHSDTNAGDLSPGTYYYRVVAVDSAGNESLPSPEAEATVSATSGTGEVALSWSPATGAVSYLVYRGTRPGWENVYQLAVTTSFIDRGGVGGISGSPPEVVDILGVGSSQCGGGGPASICFVPENDHSGGLKLLSATDGIQEAVNSVEQPGGWGGSVHIPGGNYATYAPVLVQGNGVVVGGDGAGTHIFLLGSGTGFLFLDASYSAIQNLRVSGNNSTSGFDVAFEDTTGRGGFGDDLASDLLLDGAQSQTADFLGDTVPAAGLYVAAIEGMALDRVRTEYDDYGVIVDADSSGGGSGFSDVGGDAAFNYLGGIWMRSAITGVSISGGRIFDNDGPGLVLDGVGARVSGVHMEANRKDLVVSRTANSVNIDGNLLSMISSDASCIICGDGGPIQNPIIQGNVFDVLGGSPMKIESLIDLASVGGVIGPNSVTAYLGSPASLESGVRFEPGSSDNLFTAFTIDSEAQAAGASLTLVTQYTSVIGDPLSSESNIIWAWAGPRAVTLPNGTRLGGSLSALVSGGGGVYAAGLGGVWRYGDDGWHDLTPDNPGPASALASPDGGKTLYAGTGYWGDGSVGSLAGNGILESADGGATWNELGTQQLAGLLVTDIAISPTDPADILVSTAFASDSPASAKPGLYESRDAGDTWRRTLDGDIGAVATNGSEILAAEHSQLVISSDGSPFREVAVPGPFTLAALSAKDSGFLALLAGGLRPETLTIGSDGNVLGADPLPLSDSAFASGDGGVAVAVDASGNVYAGGSQVWESSEGGAWVEVGAEIGTPSREALAAGPDGTVWLADDAGLWRSVAGGSFLDCNGGLTNFGITSLELGEIGVESAGLAGIGSIAAGDGPLTWTAVLGTGTSQPGAPVAVDTLRPNMRAAVVDGEVYFSLDGGVSWQPLLAGLPAVPVVALAFDSQENLWGATLGAGIWAVPLSGANLNVRITSPPSAPINSTVPLTAVVMELGRPLVGGLVEFHSGAWSATGLTNAEGVAAASFAAPSKSGTQTVTAEIGDSTASAALRIAPGPPSGIAIAGGNLQAQSVGQILPEPLQVKVVDRFGNPVAGAAVSFVASAGTLSSGSAISSPNGIAAVTLRLPPAPGHVTVTAELPGLGAVSLAETAQAVFRLLLGTQSLPVAPGGVAKLTVSIVPGYGFDERAKLTCVQPSSGCSLSPAEIGVGQTAVVSVLASGDPGSSLVVEIAAMAAGSGGETARAAIGLEGLKLLLATSSVQLGPGGPTAVGLRLYGINGTAGRVDLAASLAGGGALPRSLAVAFEPASPNLAATGHLAAELVLQEIAQPAGALGSGSTGGILLFTVTGIFGFLTTGFRARARAGARSALVAIFLLVAAGCGESVSWPTYASTYRLVVVANCGGISVSAPLEVEVGSAAGVPGGHRG